MALTLAGCSSGPQADLPSIAEVRSLSAEWALVNELAADGRVGITYRDSMQEGLREQIQQASQSLKQSRNPAAAEVQALLAEPDNASAATLRAHSNRLKQIEDQLESA